jgi:hypothetical protein
LNEFKITKAYSRKSTRSSYWNSYYSALQNEIYFLRQVSIKGVLHLSLSIKKILVTIDGSESSMKAAEYAISLAKKYNAQLFILYVLYSELGFAYSNLLRVTTPKAIKDVLETQKKDVQKWFNEIKINSKPPIFLWLTKSLFQHHQLLVKLWDLLTKKK